MSNWKNILKTVAPTLASAIGGPVGGLAVKAIAETLLPADDVAGKPLAVLEQTIENILVNPEPAELAKLKEADNKFKVQMEELKIDVFRLEVEDKKNARKFATDTSILPQVFITLIYNIGYFVILWGLLSGTLTLESSIKDVGLVLIGMLTQTVTETIKFWFGSSHGSKSKNGLIDKLKGK